MKKPLCFSLAALYTAAVILSSCGTAASIRKSYTTNRVMINSDTRMIGSPAIVRQILDDIDPHLFVSARCPAPADVFILASRRPGSFVGTVEGVELISMDRNTFEWFSVAFIPMQDVAFVAIERPEDGVILVQLAPERAKEEALSLRYEWRDATGDNDKQSRWEKVPKKRSKSHKKIS